MAQDIDRVIIYTDGACDPNPGFGGWGVILLYKGKYRELSGGEAHTTNNRMEIMAAIQGLEALKRPCTVTVHTDSQYLKNGITSWMPAWKRKNWKRKTGPLKNVDLWQRLDAVVQKHEVHWRWVRGHAGDVLNERCDQLACEEVGKVKAGLGARQERGR